MKKLLSLILMLVLTISCVSMISFTSSAATYGDLTYTISNGEVTITDCDSSAIGTLEIPETIEGYPVTSIAIWGMAFLENITEVKLPKTLLKIGSGAFEGCNNLSKVVISQGTTEIVSAAFRDCGSLAEITIPNSVTSIGDYAFYGCDSLTSITISDNILNIGRDVFYNTAYYNDISNWENEVLYINNHLIKSKGSNSGAYAIKEGTVTIANNAFSGCSNLTSITIPDSVISIGSYAFASCEGLTNLVIPDYVKRIEGNAFYGCNKIKTLYIGKNVSHIASADYKGINFSPFEGCTEIENIFIDENNEYYYGENNCIVEKSTQKLIFAGKNSNIPSDIKIIGAHTFRNRDFTEIYIPDSVIIIEPYAFYSCKNLRTISFSKNLKDIGTAAFNYCESISQLILPQSLEAIGYEAFSGCIGIRKVTMGKSINSIESRGLYCEAIEQVVYIGNDIDWQNIVWGEEGGHAYLNDAERIYVNGTIIGATVDLGSSLTINYFAEAPENVTMKFTSSSGKVTEVNGVFDEKTGYYKFAYEGINPQCMSDNIKAELMFGESVLDTKENYSVKTYCENHALNNEGELNLTPNQFKALRVLLADMLIYGSASQEYKDYNVENLADTAQWVQEYKSTFTVPTGVRKVTGNADSNNRAISVGLNMANVNRIYFTIKVEDSVTIKLNNKKVDKSTLTKKSDGTYTFYSENIKATQFNDVYTLELIKNGEIITKVEYNVNAYIQSKYNTAGLEDIVKALSNYGVSAINYQKALIEGDFNL